MTATREDVLYRAASLLELGIPPIRAIEIAFERTIDNRFFDSDSRQLDIQLAFMLDVSPRLTYTLVNEWRRARKHGDDITTGSLIDDFTNLGATGQIAAKYLLAFLAGNQLDRFPARLADRIEDDELEQLPSHAIYLDPAASLQVAPAEFESFDPDAALDEEDPEEFLYDDQG